MLRNNYSHKSLSGGRDDALAGIGILYVFVVLFLCSGQQCAVVDFKLKATVPLASWLTQAGK
jgi:hypothetical protein